MNTWTTRARRTTYVRTDLPTTSVSYILQRLAQPTPLYVLREQRPGTRRPSGLVKSLHNDNVVLTQIRSYRCSATTATPVTTSTLMKTSTVCETKVKNVRGSSPQSPAQLFQIRLAQTARSSKRRQAADSRGGGAGRRRR